MTCLCNPHAEPHSEVAPNCPIHGVRTCCPIHGVGQSETPDLERAREAAEELLIDKGNNYEEPIDATADIARLILEQRAEEAERVLDAFPETTWASHDLEDEQEERATDLRRQARAALSNPETGAAREAKKK